MKTTYKELQELFHLKDERQIKVGLFNKIVAVDENDITVTDEHLKTLLEKFKSSEILEIPDVSEKYNISVATVIKMIKEGRLPYYQLVHTKGSKYLFFKSELDEIEEHFELFRGKRKNLFKFYPIVEELFTALIENGKMDDNEFKIFKLYYGSDSDINVIAEKVELTPTRVLQIINRSNYKILDAIRYAIQYKKLHEDYKKKYEELIALKEYKDGFKETKIPYSIRTLIEDTNLSMRAKNALTLAKVKTIADLLYLKNKDFKHFKRIGINTEKELERFLNQYKS